MKKTQALKSKKIIQTWINKKIKEDKKSGLSYPVSLSIQESDSWKGHWGVLIATDGDALDDLYNDEGYYVDEVEAKEFGIKPGATGGNREQLQKFVNKMMKFKSSDHYLENDSYGVISYY